MFVRIVIVTVAKQISVMYSKTTLRVDQIDRFQHFDENIKTNFYCFYENVINRTLQKPKFANEISIVFNRYRLATVNL